METKYASRQSRRYDAQFKQNAVDLVLSGRLLREVAQDLGVSTFSLRAWVKRHQAGEVLTQPKTLADETQDELGHAAFLMDVIQDLGDEPTTTPKPFEKPADLKGMIELNVKMEAEDVANYMAHAKLAEQLELPELHGISPLRFVRHSLARTAVMGQRTFRRTGGESNPLISWQNCTLTFMQTTTLTETNLTAADSSGFGNGVA